jgi:hypothetical protein
LLASGEREELVLVTAVAPDRGHQLACNVAP